MLFAISQTRNNLLTAASLEMSFGLTPSKPDPVP